MSQNLLELLQNYFIGATVRQTGTALGETETTIGTTLKGVLPLVLGGLLARSQQPGGTTELFDMAQQAHSNNILGNLGSLLGGTGNTDAAAQASEGGLLKRSTVMIRSVFGSQYAPVMEAVGQQAGARPATVSSLMSMVVPVALGLLGRHVAQNKLDERGFGNYINDQRGGIMGALSGLPGSPAGLVPGLNEATQAANADTPIPNAAQTVSSLASSIPLNPRVSVRDSDPTAERTLTPALTTEPTPALTAERTPTTERTPTLTAERNPTPARWPWLLLLLLGLGAALWYFTRGGNRAREATIPMATAAATDTVMASAAATGHYDEATGNYIYAVGLPTELKLPDGTVLNVGANSTESRLYAFLNDARATVNGNNKTQEWISLDRVYFDTGKATLTAESQQQLRYVVAILQAFPTAVIKLGGFTDNTGQASDNVLLSADRVNAARKVIIEGGLAPSRVLAEGYGQEHPIAGNDTPEGRAQNRRIDVRVTK